MVPFSDSMIRTETLAGSPSDKINPANSFVTQCDRWESETLTSEIMGHGCENTQVFCWSSLPESSRAWSHSWHLRWLQLSFAEASMYSVIINTAYTYIINPSGGKNDKKQTIYFCFTLRLKQSKTKHGFPITSRTQDRMFLFSLFRGQKLLLALVHLFHHMQHSN